MSVVSASSRARWGLSFVLLGSFASAAYSQVRVSLNLPAQPLANALYKVAAEANLNILFDGRAVANLTAPALQAQSSIDDILERLLRNTGFTFRYLDDQTISIVPAAVRQTSYSASESEAGIRLAQATPSHAQNAAPSQADSALEEITVTARRREENLMKTPVAITAYTSDELAARQVERLNQISDSTPNLTWRNNTSQSNIASIIYIRGIGQGDYIPTVQPGVGVYLDGVYLGGLIGTVVDTVDIQSTEVLRGPQGTLFGRNTIGGAISIVSKKPTNEFSGEAALTYGSFNRRQVNASLNVPFTDTLYGRLSVLYRRKNGYIDTPNIRGDEGFGGDDTEAARLALRWLPADKLTVDFTADYSRIQSDGPPAVINTHVDATNPNTTVGFYNTSLAGPLGTPLWSDANTYVPLDRYTNLSGSYFRSDAKIWSTSLIAQWDLESATLKSITNRRSVKTYDGVDSDLSPLPIESVEDAMNGTQFSQEFQLSGANFADKLHWTTGLYFFKSDTVDLNPLTTLPFTLMSGAVTDNKSEALYGQFTYNLTSRASVTVGGRYTKEDFSSSVDDRTQYLLAEFDPTCTGTCPGLIPDGRGGLRPNRNGYRPLPIPPDPGAIRTQPNAKYKTGESAAEPYLNFSYQWTADLMTYTSYSEGFKGGGFTQRVVPGVTVQSFAPEYAKAYEVGAKWSGFDERLRVTGAAFLTHYSDIQVLVRRVINGIGYGPTENAGDAELKGFELEATAMPIPRLRLSAGAGYLHGKYTHVDPASLIADIPPDKRRMPSVMDWQLNASASYDIPLHALHGGLRARADWHSVSSYYDQPGNTPGSYVPAYQTVNASLSFLPESERWELSVQGRNIFNEVYYTSTDNDASAEGYGIAFMQPPAEWSVRFMYRF